MNLFSYLPAELWDLILNYLPGKNLIQSEYILKLFQDIIALNRGLKIKILLYKNNQGMLTENSNIKDQFLWLAKNRYDTETSKLNKDRLENLKWFYYHHNSTLSRGEIVDSFIFQSILEEGHRQESRSSRELRLKILKWLHSTFNLTKEEILKEMFVMPRNGLLNNPSTTHYVIFKDASESGYLNILEWLYSTFNFTTRDTLFDLSRAYMSAAIFGHLNTLKWLHSNLRLSGGMRELIYEKVFQSAFITGHEEVLKWIHPILIEENIKSEFSLLQYIKFLSYYNYETLKKYPYLIFNLTLKDLICIIFLMILMYIFRQTLMCNVLGFIPWPYCISFDSLLCSSIFQILPLICEYIFSFFMIKYILRLALYYH